MRILLINPNTSTEMTERAGAEARLRCNAGTEILPVTGEFGCAVIASRASYAIAAHAALDAYSKYGVGVDAVILACFGDPGLEALREIASVPVIGLAESAVNEAGARGVPFAIVTAGFAWVPMLTEFIRLTPHAPLFRGVFALDTTGLSFSREQDRFTHQLNDAIDRAAAGGAENIILGGAVFAGLGRWLLCDVALIDPLEAAVRNAERRVLEDVQHAATSPRPALASRGLSPQLAEILASA